MAQKRKVHSTNVTEKKSKTNSLPLTKNEKGGNAKQTQSVKPSQDNSIMSLSYDDDEFDEEEDDVEEIEEKDEEEEDEEEEEDDSEDDGIEDDLNADEEESTIQMVKKEKGRRKKEEELPSTDEIRNLTETEQLFKSNLFRLQLDELLKEVRINYNKTTAIEKALHQLKEALEGLKSVKVESMEGLYPVPLSNSISKVPFTFLPPSQIDLVGSFLLKTNCKPNLNADVAVTIPDECIKDKDTVNYRYHDKRNVYLAVILSQLEKRKEFAGSIYWSCLHGNVSKPILEIRPSKELGGGLKTNFVIRIHPVISKTCIRLNRLSPMRNNRRLATEENSNAALIPSAIYNNSILEDIFHMDHLKWLNSKIEGNENLIETIILLKIWLRQRGMSHAKDTINNFIASCLLVHLLEVKRITLHMSSYQMFRVFLQFGSTYDISKGIFFNSATQQFKEDYLKEFEVAIVEGSGMLNLGGRITKSAWQEFARDCKISLGLMQDPLADNFEALFIQKVPFNAKYDAYIQISCIPQSQFDKKLESFGFESSTFLSNCSVECDAQDEIVQEMTETLRKGLGARVLLVRPSVSQSQSWSTSQLVPEIPRVVTFGLIVDPIPARSKIDMGPSAEDSVDTEIFKEFWGKKAEMRRFPDNSILICAVWECPDDERPLIISRSAKFALERHHDVDSSSVYVLNTQFESFFKIPNQPEISISNSSIHLTKIYDQLANAIHHLESLPISVVSLRPSHPAFRSTSVFPAFSTINTSSINSSQTILHTPVNVVMKFQGSGSWPEDLAAIEKVKLALLVKMANELSRNKKLGFLGKVIQAPSTATYVSPQHGNLNPSSCLEVVYNGGTPVSFRLYPFIEKELIKLDRFPAMKEFGKYLHLEYNIKPDHHGMIHALSSKYPAYGGSVRLALRWLHSHLFSNHFDPELIELLVGYTFSSPGNYSVPATPFAGFLRFLHLLITFDFERNPIILNADKEFTHEDMSEISSEFKKVRSETPNLYSVFVSTPQDKKSSLWTKDRPSRMVLKRIISFAKKAMDGIEKNFSIEHSPSFVSSKKDASWKQIFKTNYGDYDLTLKLSPKYVFNFEQSITIPLGEFNPTVLKDETWKTLPELKEISSKFISGMNFTRQFLTELSERFGSDALFFFDELGGTTIAIVWKPTAFFLSSLKLTNATCSISPTQLPPVEKKGKPQTEVIPSIFGILNEVKMLGQGILNDVSCNNSSSHLQ